MAYPAPGNTNVRGTVERLFCYGSGAGALAGQIFGGIVRARHEDWELPNANDMTYFYQSPLVFEFAGSPSVTEGQKVTFDIAANGGAVNVVPA